MAKKNNNKQVPSYKKIILKITQLTSSNRRQKDFKSKDESMRRAISYIKKDYSRNEVELNFNKLSNIPLYKEYMLGTAFPKEYKNLETKKYTYMGNLDTEIWWTILMVKKYQSEINSFLKKQENFYSFLIYGDYEKADHLLTKIEEVFGISTWLIENKIILYSKRYGLSKQKEYWLDSRENLMELTQVLAYFYSQKSESEVSYENYNKAFDLFWQDHQELSNYFYLKCTMLIDKVNDLSYVLFEEGPRTAIDRYLTLKKILYILSTNLDKYSIKKENISNHLISLTTAIEDKELLPIKYSISNMQFETQRINQDKYVKALDLYTLGSYSSSYTACCTLLENKAFDYFSILELMAKSELRCSENNSKEINIPEDSILLEIYKDIKNITIKNDFMSTSINRLLKISMELSGNLISNQILLFIKRELPYYKSSISEQAINIGKQVSYLYDIRNIDLFSKEQRKKIMGQYKNFYTDSITYKFFTEVKEINNTKIPEHRKQLYNLRKNKNISLTDKILQLNIIIDEAHFLDVFKARIELVNLYLFKKENRRNV